jgi:TonB family protein
VLTGLSDSIQGGNHQLDTILASIAEAALNLTRATGAAVAMWKNGAVVCRARSGETAPPIGATLSADSGISGACLRTGEILNCVDTQADERVDPEVCGRLGLRSLAVVPIVGWHGINGILEVFSTETHAFTDEHISWLKQLASLAEKARALQPHSASTVVEKGAGSSPQEHQTSADRLRDVVLALIDSRWRTLVLASAGTLALLLIGFAIWLGYHTPDEADAKAAPAHPAASTTMFAPSAGGERVSKSSLEAQSALKEKPSAGTAVQLASQLERVREGKTPRDKASSDVSPAPAAVAPQQAPASPAVEAAMEPPPMALDSHNSDTLNGVLASPGEKPALAIRISQGVSDGYLVRRVKPVYPPQALLMRQQGTVHLQAFITEKGAVENVKVIDGSPMLAQAAADAVRRWQYRPYQLNGAPVNVMTDVTVNFKLGD